MRARWGMILVLWLIGPSVTAQSLSDVVIPGEDEARQAWETGEISYRQFIIIQDIIINGLDSSKLYLLDELPNLFYIRGSRGDVKNPLEEVQRDAVVDQPAVARSVKQIGLEFRHRFSQSLSADETSWYRSELEFDDNDRWRGVVRAYRTKSGAERFGYRSVTFRPRSGYLQEVTLGNFTRRFGLGTVVGYRGKLLDASQRLDLESLAYPDYGGHNGILTRLRFGAVDLEAMGSVRRDHDHRLATEAMSMTYERGGLSPGLVVGHSRLTSRADGHAIDYLSGAVNLDYRYNTGNVAVELCRQHSNVASGGASLVEGGHRFGYSLIRYALWSYSDDYVDLSAGSKSGSSFIRDTLETIDYVYSSRRVGQRGGIFRTTVRLTDRFDLTSSLALNRPRIHDYYREFRTGLVRKLDNGSVILSWRGRRREKASEETIGTEHRVRLETIFNTRRSRLRCYIAFDMEPEDDDRVGLFVGWEREIDSRSELRVWSNMSRVDLDGIHYWYIFLQGRWELWRSVNLDTKLSHRYRRGAAADHTTELTVEVAAAL